MYKLRKTFWIWKKKTKKKKKLLTIICLLWRIIKSMMANFFIYLFFLTFDFFLKFLFIYFFLWIIDIIKLKLEYNKDRNKKVHRELEVIKVEEVSHHRKRNSFPHLIYLCTSSISSKLMCNPIVVPFFRWMATFLP